MGNKRTSTMYINNSQEVVISKSSDGIHIKHRLISDDPSKPNLFSDTLLIPYEDFDDFVDAVESLPNNK